MMRHGETAWNREGRVMGQNAVELSERGRAQVEAAVSLARAIKPDLIVASPLVRARQTGAIIAEALNGVQLVHDSRLTEVQYGRWEGRTFDELLRDRDYVAYREDPIGTAIPGGETIAQVQARGVEAVRQAIITHANWRILFVSHGDVIRAVLSHFMGLALGHFRRFRIDTATFSAIRIDGECCEVEFLNLLPDPDRALGAPFASPQMTVA